MQFGYRFQFSHPSNTAWDKHNGVDGADKTALHSAAADVPEGMAKTLIKLGADTHVVDKVMLLDDMQLQQCQKIWRRSYLNSAPVNEVHGGNDIVYKYLI